MQLSKKTLEQLRVIINGDGTSDYRTGAQLVTFFNGLGFHDRYGQGFPSRWIYTDDRLERINGTPEIDKCIKNVFAVVNYVGRISELDEKISNFNQYLVFDKWKIIRDNAAIKFQKLDHVVIESPRSMTEEDVFLKKSFEVNIASLGLPLNLNDIIDKRLKEVEICVKNEATLSAVIMIGSIMEGILLGIASLYPRQFNQAQSAPKDKNGAVKKLPEWTLNNYIDVATEIGFLKQDVKKFSHAVRDFRNYIHPYSQMATQFFPDKQTAIICFQVLKAAINQIGEHRKSIQGGEN